MVKEWYKFPYDIKPVDTTTNKKLLEDFKGERTGFVQVGQKKYFFPGKYSEEAERYYNTEVREDDIWIVTFPRSGTTLTQELVWLIGNDLDYTKSKKIPLDQRFPFFEFGLFFDDEVKQEFLDENSYSPVNQSLIRKLSEQGWELIPKIETQRFIKTHFPFSLLPKDWHAKKCKTIYVARNPKDVAVSFFHLNKLFRTQGYSGSFEKYWEYFHRGLQPWTPYWCHIEEGWNRRNEPNILFLFYENIISDMPGSIKKIASFLNKTIDDQQIEKLKEHLSFENFRKNASVNFQNLYELKITNPSEQGFIREGKTNSKKKEYTPELESVIDKWYYENAKKINITFPKVN